MNLKSAEMLTVWVPTCKNGPQWPMLGFGGVFHIGCLGMQLARLNIKCTL